MEYIHSLLIPIVANVIGFLICKWLDREFFDN